VTEGDPALVERIAARNVAFWTYLGIEVDRVHEAGHVTVSIPMRDELGTRRADIMHGGALSTLIDAAAGGAVISLFGGDEDYAGQVTLDLNISFLNGVTDRAIAEARILRSSKTIGFTQIEVRDGSGTLCAVGRVTYTILRKR
jgi:uncharacterized protein (TIGR00369 family)